MVEKLLYAKRANAVKGKSEAGLNKMVSAPARPMVSMVCVEIIENR